MFNSVRLQPGDIYLTRFHPGYGAEFKRYRPAVVMAANEHLDSRFVLIAPFTTQMKIYHPQTEIIIRDNPALEQDSLLLAWYLRAIDINRLEKKLGKLSNEQLRLMKRALRLVLEI